MAKNSTFLMGLTVVAAVGSFLLSRVIWPDAAGMPMPDSAQLPFLIGISVIESIAFGIGIAFLVSMWPYMRGRETWDWLTYISAAWLLVSWWPHDNMHRVNMMGDYWGLIRIEWLFHFTLIIAGIIVASFIWKNFAMPRQSS
jgi:hypothetical protein